jgi:S1-C subfamily serine protease
MAHLGGLVAGVAAAVLLPAMARFAGSQEEATMTLLESQVRTESPRQRHPRWRLWAVLAGVGGCLLSGAAGGAIVLAVHGAVSPAATAGRQPMPQAAGPGQAGVINATRLAAAVGPAVVNINTRMDPLEGGGRAAGTGMIISRNGEVVTNNHVVQGADAVAVTIRGHGTYPAAVIGTDPAADIAVLKVSGLSGLPAVRFGDSARIAVGSQVLAIGNALGLGGSPTVSQGIISATGRSITATDQTGSNPERLHGLLQTDAPIAPGNSGGPLVDAAGAVIGMDTAAASAGTGGASLGFAIPANTIRVIAGEITAHQNLPRLIFGRRPFLGVEVVNSSQIANAASPFGPFGNPFGLPTATTPSGTRGVVVAAVDPGSPAARAGITGGDVITAIDGHATPTTAALSRQVGAHKPGQVVSVTVSTQGGTRTAQIRLGMGPIG